MKTKKDFPNINFLWASLLVEELIRQGIEYFCIAPGSRSGPLAVAVARNNKAKSLVHFDERGVAFHAMGYVAASGKPAVLICSSGTAVANFLPAIVEASKKKLPLIVLTADRPPELRKTGANQTIEQPGIFGAYVRWAIDLPCPDRNIPPEFVLTTADQAVFRAYGELRGPVHLNCMFREPLVPVATKEDFWDYLKNIRRWMNNSQVYTDYVRPQRLPTRDDLVKLAATLNAVKSGIIVVGKINASSKNDEQQSVLKFAQKLGWPIFADITSGLRLGCQQPQVIQHFDQILLSDQIFNGLRVDCVMHLGGRITSRRFYDWVCHHPPSQYVMVLNHPLRNDPLHHVTLRFQCTIKNFCDRLVPLLRSKKKSEELSLLQKLSGFVHLAMEQEISQEEPLSEPLVARLISKHIPKGTGLFLSNSMPIRDMDVYAARDGAGVIVAANRGASGIDGIIASACGFSIGLQKPVTLLIGDLAFLHDLSSLSILSRVPHPCVVVVLNNNGGAIFSFLPIVHFSDVFESHFALPHNIGFEHAAKLFGLNYHAPQDGAEFIRQYQNAFKNKSSTVIEIKIDRSQNRNIHLELQKKIRGVLLAPKS